MRIKTSNKIVEVDQVTFDNHTICADGQTFHIESEREVEDIIDCLYRNGFADLDNINDGISYY